EWLRLALTSAEGILADLTLTRSLDWLRANYPAIEALRRDSDLSADVAQWNLVRRCVDVQDRKRVQLAYFWPARWVQAHGLTVAEPLFFKFPKEKLFGEGRLVGIEPAPFVPHPGEPRSMMFIAGRQQSRDKATIASAEVGDYTVTYTAEERGEEPA